jgi:hypothetical protein
MTIAGLVRVKNEADIIEAFVRHHARLFDRLVIVDNASADGTREIILALIEEGLPIALLDDATFVFRQSELTTYLARAVFAQTGCERLFLLDADEFLVVADRAALEAAIGLLPVETHALLPWRTYLPTADDRPADGDPRARIVHRMASERVQMYKLALSASFCRDAAAIVMQGAHDLADASPGANAVHLAEIPLAHLPLRDPVQLATKTLIGWNAYIAMNVFGGGYAFQWQHAYTELMGEPLGAEAALLRLAASYPRAAGTEASAVEMVRDPLPTTPLRYAALRIADPVRIVGKALEQLARQAAASAEHAATALPALRRAATTRR